MEDKKDFEEVLENEYDLKIDVKKILDKKELDLEKSNEEIIMALQKKYDKKSDLHKDIFSEVEKQIVLQVIDQSWKNHINALEQLRQNIGFRSYAGKDPRLEYKRESFEMFQELLENIKFESIRYLSKITISSDENSLSQPESKKSLLNALTPHHCSIKRNQKAKKSLKSQEFQKEIEN